MDRWFSTVEETLENLIEKVTHRKCSGLNPRATFKDLGVDSLGVVHILVSLEDIYGIELVDKEMRNIRDMQGFIDYIEHKIEEKAAAGKAGSR